MKGKCLVLKNLTPILIFGSVALLSAQEKLVLQNNGLITVSPNEILTVMGEFANTKDANFVNSGEVYFFDDFTNEGVFVFAKSQKASKVFFEQLAGATSKQKISGGTNSTFFEDVVFNNEGVDLQNEISIAGKASFERGHVVVNTPLSGAITFMEGSSVDVVSDQSHAVGLVEREGKSELEMPVGDGTFYRPITIGESKGIQDLFQAEYKRSNPLEGRAYGGRSAIIEVNNAEYWEVQSRAIDSGVILTLSWNEQTTPSSLLSNPESNLQILHWDPVAAKWEIAGGIVDVANKTVKTPIAVGAEGIFTLGTVDVNYNAEIKIYNAVSPNGDGRNDYFIIENIDKYPNSTVQIVNRWGAKVYESSGYDRNGDGSMNVFKGEAEGKGVSGKGVSGKGKLPSGTYYYIIKYEVTTASGSEMKTKTGYLQLENN